MNQEIKDLKSEISRLKRELHSTKTKYTIELRNNMIIIDANARLQSDNKYLKRDVKRISKALEYIESCKKDTGHLCNNVKTIRDILRGSDKE